VRDTLLLRGIWAGLTAPVEYGGPDPVEAALIVENLVPPTEDAYPIGATASPINPGCRRLPIADWWVDCEIVGDDPIRCVAPGRTTRSS
jgi:hypothetical protein